MTARPTINPRPLRSSGTILIPAFPVVTASGAINGQFVYKGFRVIIPWAGTLKNFYIAPSVQSGNVEGVILDDTATTRQRLWTSGSQSCPATNVWTSIADPNLAVREGQHVDFLLGADNATAAFFRYSNMPLNALVNLPSGILVSPGGAAGWASYQYTAPNFSGFTSLAEANFVAQGAVPMILVELV